MSKKVKNFSRQPERFGRSESLCQKIFIKKAPHTYLSNHNIGKLYCFLGIRHIFRYSGSVHILKPFKGY